MVNPALQNISEFLQKKQNHEDPKSDNFYAFDELQFDDLNIEVEGLGKLNFPITDKEVESLIKLSSQAKFGFKDQTVLDTKVRDTQEITSDKLNVTINPESLNRVLNNIRQKFYLSDNSYFLANLYNMLVYSPGQFFKTHQDTEKCENMIATLILVLPHPHIGGDLIIEHENEKIAFSSENIVPKVIKCAAFFSDCKHGIEKIKEGHRIVMTFNLALVSNNKDDDWVNSETDILGLQNNVLKYFQLQTHKDVQMLVVHLTHKYTEHSLKWQMLKGIDRVNVSALMNVARNLGLVPYLTLVEIHKTYTAENDFTIEDLIENEIVIEFWVDENNQTFKCNYHVSDDNVCFSGLKELETDNEEEEEYQGNAPATVDKWYHSAAIVLIAGSDIIAFNFKVNYDTAFEELIMLTQNPGNEEKIKNLMTNAGKNLFSKNYKSNYLKNFISFAEITMYLNDKDYALDVLKKISGGFKILNNSLVQILIKLQLKFGVEWFLLFLNKLKEDKPHYSNNKLFLKDIDSFISDFIKYGVDVKVAEFILEEHTRNVISSESTSGYIFSYQYNNQTKIEKLEKTLLAIIMLKKIDLLIKIINHIISNIIRYTIIETAEFLSKFMKTISPEIQVYFKELKNCLKEKIDSEVAASMRDENDWSITGNIRCTCEHCRKVLNFLRSKTDVKLVWPTAQRNRNHVMGVLRNTSLPINVTVERVGSPQRLVIEKTSELHRKSKEKFVKLKIVRQKILEL